MNWNNPDAGRDCEEDEQETLSFGQFQDEWEMWSRKLHRYARRQLEGHQVPSAYLDSDDVVQMTWLVLHRNQRRIRQPQRYMYAVALRIIHRAANTASRLEEQPDDFLGQPTASAEQEAVNRETSAEIRAARRRLTGQQQFVISALFDEGLSYKDVARSLDISAGAVSSHRDRALAKMRTDCNICLVTGAAYAKGYAEDRAAARPRSWLARMRAPLAAAGIAALEALAVVVGFAVVVSAMVGVDVGLIVLVIAARLPHVLIAIAVPAGPAAIIALLLWIERRTDPQRRSRKR